MASVHTNFFSSFTSDDDRVSFLSDFLSIAAATKEKTDRLLQIMHSIPILTDGSEEQKTIGSLATSLEIEIPEATVLLSWTQHILQLRQNRQYVSDTPTEWADDVATLLKENEFVKQKDLPPLRSLATEIASVLWLQAEQSRPRYLALVYSRGILPRFRQLESTAELRAVIDNGVAETGQLSDDVAVAAYSPTIVDLVTIASVHIATDTRDQLYVQMTYEDVKAAIRALTATLRELEALQKSVTLNRANAKDDE